MCNEWRNLLRMNEISVLHRKCIYGVEWDLKAHQVWYFYQYYFEVDSISKNLSRTLFCSKLSRDYIKFTTFLCIQFNIVLYENLEYELINTNCSCLLWIVMNEVFHTRAAHFCTVFWISKKNWHYFLFSLVETR